MKEKSAESLALVLIGHYNIKKSKKRENPYGV
jgi:hypothetical protein